MSGCKRNARKEQPGSCSGAPRGWKCCQRVERMTKGLTRLTGVKGRSPKMYSGGQDRERMTVPSGKGY